MRFEAANFDMRGLIELSDGGQYQGLVREIDRRELICVFGV